MQSHVSDIKKSPDLINEIKPGDAVFHPRNYTRCPVLGTLREHSFFRFSGFRIVLLTAPSHRFRQWHLAVFVPGYGGGSATASNRLPCLLIWNAYGVSVFSNLFPIQMNALWALRNCVEIKCTVP